MSGKGTLESERIRNLSEEFMIRINLVIYFILKVYSSPKTKKDL
jgi:hypothetical protein